MIEVLLKIFSLYLKICWLQMYYRSGVRSDMELDHNCFEYNKPVHAR